ncbi:MAG: hypothetical protein AAFW76_11760, partial [Pseudomonadota bacterium]
MTKLIKIAEWTGPPRGHAIFVHGLGGHAYDTWRASEAEDALWPAWLAEDIEGLCVWSLSYQAPMTNWRGTAPPLQDRAIAVLEQLLTTPELREGPITFICHSLGGLVVKQVLRAAEDQRDREPEIDDLLMRIKGVAFLATPHTGAGHASAMDALRLVFWPSAAAQDLVRNSATLRHLNDWYRDWSGDIAHKIYFETQGTIAGTMVDAGSANAGLPGVRPIGIDADHIEITKPASREELVYKSILAFLADDCLPAQPQSAESRQLDRSPIKPIHASSANRWAPIALRLAVLAVVAVIGFTGVKQLAWPGDPLAAATVEQIEVALQLKHPELTPEQIDRIVESLREARGDPSFDEAVAEAEKGNTHVAEGIWRQLYEDRKSQQIQARREQAEAARNLAAIAVTNNVKEALAL